MGRELDDAVLRTTEAGQPATSRRIASTGQAATDQPSYKDNLRRGTMVSRKLLRLLVAGIGLTLLAAPIPSLAEPAGQDSNEVVVLVGAGQDTTQLLNYFPATVRVHTGDTVTWKINGDELHTVASTQGAPLPPFPATRQAPGGKPGEVIPTFAVPVPGGGPSDLMVNPLIGFASRPPGAPVETYSGNTFVSSGLLQKRTPPGAPPNDTMSVVFDTPGTYSYLCLIHTDRMFGTIEVVGTDEDADNQDSVSARARAEIAAEMPLTAAAREQGQQTKKEAGPNDNTVWYVRAGMSDIFSGDGRAQVMEFLPKDLSVKAGDSVVWGSAYFHSVSFVPTAPPPEFVVPKPQPGGPPQLVL